VWKALDNEANCRVAIKVLHSNLADHGISRDRFFRGAQIMYDLSSNDGIVSVLRPECEDDNFYYFVMEMLHDGNLQDAVLSKRIAADRAAPIMDRILEILAAAHAHPRRYVHRDVKPTNVLLTETGAIKLTDFDLVLATNTTGGTRTGMLGTVRYAAPEQWNRPQDVDQRADLYSVAMTGIFVLHGGELAFHEFLRDRKGFIDRLPASKQLREVLLHATEWNPEARFKNASEFQAALRDGLHRNSTEAQSVRSRRKKPRKRKGRVEPAEGESLPPRQKKRYPIPEITPKRIEQALATFDRDHRDKRRWHNFTSNPKHRYAVEHNGRLYPVKKILSLATGIPIGHFSGGSSANKRITDCGLVIVELRKQE
jgi:serine/threonine protein kinase